MFARGAKLKEAREIAALGGPLVVNNLVQVGMQVTDTVMAGRLSGADLAAVAVGGAVFMPIFIFGLGVMMALTPTIAQLHGAGRETEVGHWVRQGLWLALLVTVPTVVFVANGAWVLHAFSVDPSIIPLASGYMQALAFGVLPMYLYLAFRFFSEGTSETRPMMYISAVALPLNVLFNWVFMYELGMGAVGCGVATAIVMGLMLCMMLANVQRRHYRQFEPFVRFDWLRPADLRQLLWLGIPIGMTLFMEFSMFGAAALMMGSLGANIVAAHQIAVNFAAVMFMIPMGLSFAISVRIGRAIGRGDLPNARMSGMVGIQLCAAIMAVSAVLMLLFRQHIAGLYTNDPGVIAVATGLLLMAALFQLSDGIQAGALGVLRGFKDTRASMVLTMIAYWGVGIPLAWWLGIRLNLGPAAVWVGLIAGLSVAAALLLWRFAYNTRHARVD
ncbi:MAG: MATE family efflux transporter [Xanthomonadaceae bacterium]|nr:MATE family efflux transporter [Xanthomonadaceae bacterium]